MYLLVSQIRQSNACTSLEVSFSACLDFLLPSSSEFKILLLHCLRSWGSSVCIVTDYTLEDRSSIPGRDKIFFLLSVSRPGLRPTQPRIQWVLGVLSRCKAWRGVTLTTHPHLVPRSRMNRGYTSSPLGACMAVTGQLYWTVLTICNTEFIQIVFENSVHSSKDTCFH
jgi:hypothetical protein